MADPTLFEQARLAAGYDSPAAFAREVLGVTPRAAQHWAAGTRPLDGLAAQLCRAIVARPSVVAAIRREPARVP